MTADHIVAEHAELRAVMLRLRAAQRDQLQAACHWADSHPWLGDLTNPSGVETVSRFAGEGTPEVEPGSVAEFAALLGLSTAGVSVCWPRRSSSGTDFLCSGSASPDLICRPIMLGGSPPGR